MDLLEYQGKQLFAQFNIPIPEGGVASDPVEAGEIAGRLGFPVVIKAQVKIGGRGKAGGVKLVASVAEAKEHAQAIIGMDIKGHQVRQVLVERASDIDKEYYAALIFDRSEKKPVLMLSSMGGMDVEEVAEKHPEAIAKVHIDPYTGFQGFYARRAAYGAGIDPALVRDVGKLLGQLYQLFEKCDAMLVEVNPLIVTTEGKVIALDSKVTIDDNALYRQPKIAEMRSIEEEDPQERMAREKGLTYVKLDGSVGVLGNGAGLVMSTLDVVAQAGGRPANFLDVGGGAKAEEIVESLEVILSDEKVKAVLFNIFGGITRCDEVAQGIIDALGKMDVKVPLVVRLDGTNDEQGRELLEQASPKGLEVEGTMLGAAERVVELAA